MHDWTKQKQVMILDEEKLMLNSLWDAAVKLDDKKIMKTCEYFIEYLSIQYGFDPKNFTLYDKEGKLIHRRVPRG